MQLFGHRLLFREPHLVRSDVELANRNALATGRTLKAGIGAVECDGGLIIVQSVISSSVPNCTKIIMLRMDNTIWIATILAHVAILAIITYRAVNLPAFTITILFGILESFILYQVHRTMPYSSYYHTYYICDLINIGLYCASIRECRQHRRFELISFSMAIYLVPKLLTYGFMAFHERASAIRIHGMLRPMNLSCLACWCAVLWMYSEDELPTRNYGGFMDTNEDLVVEEVVVIEEGNGTETDASVEPEFVPSDPGAPPPIAPQ